MKRVTINDVAKLAGVSKSTVSQYLNKRYEYMSESTKEKIKSSIEELDYTPNIIARSLTQKSTMTIGVIVANILHTFSTKIIRAIEDYCNELNFHVIVCNADDNPQKEKRYIEMLWAKQVDGIIIFPTDSNINIYKNLVNSRYPIVFMDRKVGEIDVDTILLENEKASIMAVEEFVKNDYSRIGMIAPPTDKNISPRIERIAGYKKGLENNNIPFNPNYLVSTEISKINIEMTRMLRLSEPPQAFIAANDLVIFEILKYAKKNQINIPDDIGLIGIDDVPFASYYTPALTTIAQPVYEMGKKAANLLLDKIKQNRIETKTTIYRFQPRLKVRSSSKSLEDNLKMH